MINNVEDVLSLGQPVEVRVDDIDPQGKVSLSLANAPEARHRSLLRGNEWDSGPRQRPGPLGHGNGGR